MKHVKMNALRWFLTLVALPMSLAAQETMPTMGTTLIKQGAYEGYTLFSPASNKSVYLIDNCGAVVNSWDSDYHPGNAVYLMENGDLYRAGRLDNDYIHAGGGGGIIERFDWDGNLLWSFTYSSSLVRAHHDFQVLSNGNVLVLAWEEKLEQEVLDNGRNPELLDHGRLWPEHIIEVVPVGNAGGEIVWEWHAWDHMIQDFDDTKLNYGVVADHPEKININYIRPEQTGADWHHANAINYNSQLDQIIISVLYFDEVWIIDHNTTSEEAQGTKGDLLFRWGNPQAYDHGAAIDKKLYGQHNVQWIAPGLPDEGKLLIFNNGQERPEELYTTVVKIDPIFEDGVYKKGEDGRFLPENFFWEYKKDPPTDFYSRFISGAQQLPNGNVLIDDGAQGIFFEIDTSEEIVWQYINPIDNSGIRTQGEEMTDPRGKRSNTVFRATKYSTDYPAFTGRNINPGLPIEKGAENSYCQVILEVSLSFQPSIYPNPASEYLTINGYEGYYQILDLQGHQLMEGNVAADDKIALSSLFTGTYILQVGQSNPKKFIVRR